MVKWPELVTAVGLALLAAYLIADRVASAVAAGLRSILPDEHDAVLVSKPKRVVRIVSFLVAAAALIYPALRLIGYDADAGSPKDFRRLIVKWVTHDGMRVGVRVCAIALTAYIAIRLGSAAARRFERDVGTGTGLDVIERAKRARTLSAMLQKTLTVVVVAVASLMILRELDIDTTPVLTSAGILGLAVGFGAQTLVRDVISGFFLILEDQVRVGDVAVVNGQGGLVESVNLRTIVLRDEEGTVHVFPNGEVKTLANRSKDFAYFVVSVAIALDNPDPVIAAMQEAGAALAADPEFKPHILSPLEVQGVEDFQPGRITVKARIKTVPLKQWLVGRELRKRIAATFKARGIAPPAASMNVKVENLDRLLRSKGEKGSI
jgi:small conductance mechanosensitive channel